VKVTDERKDEINSCERNISFGSGVSNIVERRYIACIFNEIRIESSHSRAPLSSRVGVEGALYGNRSYKK
jgi:hypothetical protein